MPFESMGQGTPDESDSVRHQFDNLIGDLPDVDVDTLLFGSPAQAVFDRIDDTLLGIPYDPKHSLETYKALAGLSLESYGREDESPSEPVDYMALARKNRSLMHEGMEEAVEIDAELQTEGDDLLRDLKSQHTELVTDWTLTDKEFGEKLELEYDVNDAMAGVIADPDVIIDRDQENLELSADGRAIDYIDDIARDVEIDYLYESCGYHDLEDGHEEYDDH